MHRVAGKYWPGAEDPCDPLGMGSEWKGRAQYVICTELGMRLGVWIWKNRRKDVDPLSAYLFPGLKRSLGSMGQGSEWEGGH